MPTPRTTARAVFALRCVTQFCVALAAMLFAGAAGAQVQRTFVNLGFELPSAAPSTCFFQVGESAVPGWTTNHPSQNGTACAPNVAQTPGPLIEIWTNGFSGVASRLGNQFAELNAEAASRIFQNVCLANGEPIGWRFSHRGRQSATVSDVMEFRVGSTSGTNRVIRAATQNDGGIDPPTCYGTSTADGSVSANTCSDAAASGGWHDYSGQFTWTGTTGVQAIGFEAISTGSGNATIGNFIDDIQVTLRPFVEFSSATYEVREGASSPTLPAIRVVGTVPAGGIAVNVAIAAGGSATRGSDYTTPGDVATVTVNVPAGVYDGNDIPLPLTLVDDALIEDNESLTLTITSSPTNYVLSSTRTCGGSPVLEATMQLVDNDLDAAVTLDAPAEVVVNHTVAYTLTATQRTARPSAGNLASHDATVTLDAPLPTGLVSQTWTCTATGGARCPGGTANGTTTGSGAISGAAFLPAGDASGGGAVSYAINATPVADACGTVTLSASLTLPAGVAEGTGVQAGFATPAPGGTANNSATTQAALVCNRAPVAQAANVTASAGTAVVTLQATDPDGDTLGYRIVTPPSHGTLTGTAPNVVYVATQGYLGSDSFTFVAFDAVLDSAPATISVNVTGINHAPSLTSAAPTEVNEGATYNYPIVASDADSNEAFTYRAAPSPSGFTIDANGTAQWPADASIVGVNRLPNTQCRLDGETVSQQAAAADFVVVVDESNSMDGEHAWIADIAAPLEAHLATNGIGAGTLPNRYGLIGFDYNVRPINVGSTLMGTHTDLIAAAAKLRMYEGIEDGYYALDYVMTNYPLRSNVARNFLLITDEDRDPDAPSITYATIFAKLQTQKAMLNAVVDARFTCGDGSVALGMGQDGMGYKADGHGGFLTCNGATASAGFGTTIADYVTLALATGGAAWDIETLRDGGLAAQSFTAALFSIKVREILDQLPERTQPDLYVHSLRAVDGSMTVVVGNRGLADVTQSFNVELSADGTTFATLPIASLAAGAQATRTQAWPGSAANPARIAARVVPPAGVVECKTDNNQVEAVWARVFAADRGGLEANQGFSIAVADVNAPPIVNAPAVTQASVGRGYDVTVTASDPDRGDALRFSLGTHPAGMRIDALTGRLRYTPDASQLGPQTVQVRAQDLAGAQATATFTLTVDAAIAPPRFTSTPITRAIQGTTYDYAPTVSADPLATLAFDAFLGPPGFTMNPTTGEIHWPVPADYAGKVQHVVLRVRDGAGNYDLQVYTLYGDQPDLPPNVTSTPPSFATIGTAYAYTATATDPNVGDKTLAWRADRLPTGMTLSPAGAVAWPAASVASAAPAGMAVPNPQCRSVDATSHVFSPVLRWSSASTSVGQPIIGPLIDSNLDGHIDGADRAVIVAIDTSEAKVNAYDAVTGAVIWSVAPSAPNGFVAPAMADLDGSGAVSVLYMNNANKLVALRPDGSLRWTSAASPASSLNFNAIEVTDLDGDGNAEILVGPSVYGHDGRIRWSFPAIPASFGVSPTAVDIDGDGRREVLLRNEARRADGTLLWTLQNSDPYSDAWFAPAPAGTEAALYVSGNDATNNLRIAAVRANGTVIWQQAVARTGPLVVADVASAPGVEIFHPATGELFAADGTRLWRADRQVWTDYAGISAVALDIDADGSLDLVSLGYQWSAPAIRVLAGESGALLAQYGRVVGSTNYIIAPVFADARGDGSTQLVLGNGKLEVYEPAQGRWPVSVRAMPQKAMAPDRFDIGLRPRTAQAGVRAAAPYVLGAPATVTQATVWQPDLRVSGPYGTGTAAGITLKTDVFNRGTGTSRAFRVAFYRGADAQEANKLGEASSGPLAVGATATLSLAVTNADLGNTDIAVRVLPAADDIECETGNNVAVGPVVRIAAVDPGGLAGTQAFAIGVEAKPVAPTFTSNPADSNGVAPGAENVLYEYDANATSAMVGDALTYSLYTFPPGATIDSATGLVRWTPRWGQTGSFWFEVRATSLSGAINWQQWRVVVTASTAPNTAPQITSTAPTSATVGEVYRYDVLATDAEGHAITYTLSPAPAGMQIDATTGVVSWVPPSVNAGVAVGVVATDARGLSTRQDYTLRVYATPNRAPSFTTTPALSSTPGSAYHYAPAATDPDGDAVTIVWITKPTGATLTGSVLDWTPASNQTGEQAFSVEARDNRGGVARQDYTVFVNAPSNTAPVIDSQPGTNAVVGVAYAYAAHATDAENDTLAYTLAQAPAGMTIASSGLVSWTPTAAQAGTQSVRVQVSDGRGGVAWQSYTITVNATAGNRAPAITSAPPTQAQQGRAYRYDLLANDPDGDTLAYTLRAAPSGMTITANGRIDWQPTALADEPVRVRVSDGTAWIEQSWTIHVSEVQPLAARLDVTPDSVLPNEPVQVTVIADHASGQVTATLELDGQTVALDANHHATLTSATVGEHGLVATVSDGTDVAGATGTFRVRDPSGAGAPQVTLATPLDLARITAPANVIGTVNDTDLASWELWLRDNTTGTAQRLAQGTQNVANASVGTLDTTRLLNGQYALILQARDAAGNLASDSRTVTIDGDMKLGHYAITFEEVTIPLAGIPITVTRTYDTRRAHESLDFGHGWTVDASNVRVHESRKLGFAWGLYEYRNGLFANWCVQPNGDPIVTVTLPDGDVQRFKAKASPECQMFVPATNVQIVFEPLDGTFSKLEQRDYGNVRLVGNQVVELGDVALPVDPNKYRLTTREGLVYDVDQNFGLRQLTEPNSQNLTFSRDGVLHSSGVGIRFVRDTQGRITRMELPDGTAYEYRYTASGDLDRVIDPLEHATQFTYAAPNHPHYLKDIVDARGVRVTRNEYDETGRLVATIDADNHRIEYTHNVAGRAEQVKDRRGYTTTYVYDDNGWVLTETNARNETTTRTYDPNGFVLTVKDPRDKTTTMTYDAVGNLLTEKNPLQQTTTSTYNASNQLLTQKDAADRVLMTNTYNDRNKALMSTKDALGNTTSFTYDDGTHVDDLGTGELTGMTDAMGRTTRYAVNLLGWRWKETDAQGNVTEYDHDTLGRVKTETRTRTDAAGTHTLVTAYTYDDKGRLTQTDHPDGSTTKTTYNQIDKPISQCDALERCTTIDYDNRGQETAQHYPDGTSETKTYDANGNLATETDREGRTTKYEYDEANRLTVTRYPDATPNDDTDNPKSVNVYDAAGRLTSTTNARGYATTYGYDDAGRTTTVKDVLNNTTTTAYDVAGRRLSVTDALSRKTSFVYDAAGKVTQTLLPDATPTSDTDNPRTTIDYDALGRKVAETDPMGRITRFAYDTLGRLERVVLANPTSGANPALVNGESPAGSGTLTTRYTYDELGNKRTQTDALNHVTTWTYDDAGRVLTRTLPMGQVETFQYDDAGRRTQFTDFRGRITTYVYKPNTDWLATINYATQADVSMTYTPGGQIAQVTDGNGVTTYTYDERGRLDSVTWPNTLAIAYDYDANGNRTKLTTAQQVVDYTFDELDRLKTVTPSLGGGAAYTYDAVGNRKTVTHANNVKTTYAYNERNHLTQVRHDKPNGQALQTLNYDVDKTGLRNGISDAVSSYYNTYTYDKLKRLTQDWRVSTASRVLTWTYDGVGNRLTEARNGVSTTYTYDANDRMTQHVTAGTGGGTTTYTYDDAGNLTQKSGPQGIESYTYNDANQLEQLTAINGEVTRYAYNHNGIRLSQTRAATSANPVTEHYLVDPNQAYAQVIEEHEQQGGGAKTLSALYTFGDDRISQYRPAIGATPAATRHYHADGLGSVRLLTDPAATVTDKYNYDAFGELDAATSQVTSDNDFRYTGEQVDLNSGFYYLRARYMNPANGRFTQQDGWSGRPSEPLTLNKYLYANAAPVDLADPSGNMAMADVSLGPSILGTLSTTAINSAFNAVTRVGVRLLLAMGTAALTGSSSIVNNERTQNEARREQERLVVALAAVASSRSLLFHYTDPASAAEIMGCRCIRATRGYSGHMTQGDGIYRPEGAYATPIPPWLPSMTQRDLASFLWLKPGNRSVAAAVVIRNNGDWSAVTGIEWIKRGPRGSDVPIDAVLPVPNLMKP